jgi:hypothetical protein
MREDGRTEIYSKYSKGREQLNRSDYEAVAEKLSQNEYISNETFEAFMAKKLQTRPGKRINFPQNSHADN